MHGRVLPAIATQPRELGRKIRTVNLTPMSEFRQLA
jgi:hypothetical protein